ncbi:metalloendopeptidase [Desmophyllum pertusum]|uniref:Metalloendopeptidase n=1 Tax=Desmophyllum pertusum TaxID=174260 RepID=A0A9W9YIP0_9CNID|nr:metalloendopeptidase [Desmophyllum pertusum]
MRQSQPLAMLMVLLSTVFCGAFARTMHTLHHHMTENDLQYFFGVDDHLQVPEYDVIIPHQLDERGLPLSDPQRQRRTEEPRENIFYKVAAFGRDLHLNLTLNRKLMSRDLVMETRHADGTVSYASPPKNTYYLGHVMSDPHSIVAVSDDGGLARGLTGMLKLSRDTMFIHPLPTHLAKRAVSSEEKWTPHLIYKNSPEIDFDVQSLKREFKESTKISDTAKRGNVRMKTMEAALMLEADTAAKLDKQTYNAQRFLLLLGNAISGLLMDPSIGETRIYYVVLRIIIIDKEVFGAEYSDSKETWMSKLASYSKAHNNPDDANPEHYDVCSLVYSMRTGVGGSASFNTMCNQETGNVNNMVGLQTALIITHETGHNMGVDHDGTSADCPDSTYIMSATLPGGSSAVTWSDCSRKTMQDFLRSDRSWCLNDEAQNKATVLYNNLQARSIPGDMSFDTPEVMHRTSRDTTELIDLKKFQEEYLLVKLPGEILSADDQCTLQYGDNYRQCSQKAYECGHLWCTSDGFSCESRYAPSGDGTPCGSRNVS